MKLKMITLFMVTLIAAALFSYGCGGGDASFSPDPTVADVPGGEDPAGGGGGTGDDSEGSSKEVTERDCFLDGFCYRTCSTAEECPAGFSCIMKVCTFDCQSDDECGTGGDCNDAGLCEATDGGEIPACTQNSECGDGRFCNDEGNCEQVPVLFSCVNDADCPAGQYCEDVTHECELFPSGGVACAIDADCPGNYYCSAAGSCEQECRTDYQCSAGNACDSHGRCTTAGLPARLASFSFSSAGTVTGTSAPAIFESTSYKIDMVEIVPAGRDEILSSSSFRLMRSGTTTAQGADAPNTISYAGYLTDAAGIDIDRDVRIEMRLYDSLMGGIGQGVTNSHVIYAEDHTSVEAEGGVFRLRIGGGVALNPMVPSLPIDRLLETESVYIELWIDGERLSPRQRMGSMPAVFHARYARYADHVDHLPAITPTSLPSYPAELITTGTLSANCIPPTLNTGSIAGVPALARFPAIPVDRFDTTGSLPSGMIGQMDATKIVGGTLSRDRLPATSYVARENFVVLTGSASNEQMLVFPDGFDQATQCKYMLTPGITLGAVEGIDQIYLELLPGNVVHCQIDQNESSDSGDHRMFSCTANYMIVCQR